MIRLLSCAPQGRRDATPDAALRGPTGQPLYRVGRMTDTPESARTVSVAETALPREDGRSRDTSAVQMLNSGATQRRTAVDGESCPIVGWCCVLATPGCRVRETSVD